MNPTVITARVSDQHLQLVNEALVASGGVDVLQIRFEFCGLWSGCGKTAVFYRNPDEVYHVPVTDNLVTVPWEVLTDEGHFYFGVFGVKSNRRATEVVKINVEQGALTTATATPEDPAPDIYDQLMAAYGHMEQKVVDACAEMEQGLADTYDKMEQDTNLMHARLDAAIAMRGANGAVEYAINGEGVTGKLTTNGSVVSANFHFNVAPETWYGGQSRYIELPVYLAPLQPSVEIPTLLGTDAYLKATIYTDEDGDVFQPGSVVLCIDCTLDSTQYVYGFHGFKGTYPLAKAFLDEVSDIRVGADGTTYETAGEAVRAQLSGVSNVAVDQELNDASTNAIANKVVTTIFNELADIRAGADDITYNTAGDAVRYQLVEIKQAVASAVGIASDLDRRLALEVAPAVASAVGIASDLDRRLTLEVEPAVAESAAKIGDIETALNGIIAIQEALIGGEDA